MVEMEITRLFGYKVVEMKAGGLYYAFAFVLGWAFEMVLVCLDSQRIGAGEAQRFPRRE